MKIKEIFSDWRMIILIVVLLLTVVAIKPTPWKEGIEVVKVNQEELLDQGMGSGEIIKIINGKNIETLEDFSDVVLGEKIDISTDRSNYAYLGNSLNIIVKEVDKSKIKKGLDLAGGTRVLLKPKEKVSDQQMDNLDSIMKTRLDVYGLSDLNIRKANDLSGNKFLLVEISGATQDEVRELIGQQGKFEAKIGEDIVFIGEKKDIKNVCKDDGSCSGVSQCGAVEGNQEQCRFEFRVTLSNEAAKKHAELTGKLEANESNGRYLSKKIDFYLDGELVDSLFIGADLKGVETADILISGPGSGVNRDEALDDALKNMNKLQTILMVGSLPFELEIVKMDSISPRLGLEFFRNIFLVGALAILSVAVVIFIRYRNFKIILPAVITMMSEIFIIVGVAAFIGWRLDLAAIAGILASVGTGVDDQIVITDEVMSGDIAYDWKDKLKKAFFIIFVAYFTTVAAMLPLWNAGAGLVRGFALTTIIGVTIGVFVTRPAFASMIEKLLKN
ncbi:preprotein translocase subunit SecD [archaeon]|nr:preprotein translocase subunit SecD [archaeon]|tara:strand:- start:1593 stop:3098 length:1506 start_codon:yes stop_codon:yes gene_type:complete